MALPLNIKVLTFYDVNSSSGPRIGTERRIPSKTQGILHFATLRSE